MTRRATDRLIAGVVVVAGGLMLSILAGRPEAAVLVAPWAVLLVLGLARSQTGQAEINVSIDAERVVVGDDVAVEIAVSGMSGTMKATSVPSDSFRARQQEAGEGEIHEVLIDDPSVASVPLSTTQWGVHDLGHVKVVVTDPYGLFRWSGNARSPLLVRVHPKPSQIRSLVSPWLVRSVTGAHLSNLSGRGVEYADIRPFTSGDTLRDINWKASARSQELWISQRHPDRATDVVMLLDSFIESGHDVRTVFGLAVQGAIALAQAHIGVADRVGLVQLGGTVIWLSPGAGAHQLQRLTDRLLSTELHAHIADRNLALLMSRALPPRSFVMALTPLLDNRFIEAVLTLDAHGHDVAVVECSPVSESSSDPIDPVTRVAGRIWEAERQVTRDRLTERGVAVAAWHQGDHLDQTLVELRRRRLAISRKVR